MFFVKFFILNVRFCTDGIHIPTIGKWTPKGAGWEIIANQPRDPFARLQLGYLSQ